MSEEINVDEVIRTIQFSEIAQKGYKVMSNDEFDRIVNGVLKLQQENQELKQINEEMDELATNQLRYANKMKSVLDEIKQYIEDDGVSYLDLVGTRCWCNKQSANKLLQILDKVKE
jgi:predicted transcriptional regulator